jgi:hypothetical protein
MQISTIVDYPAGKSGISPVDGYIEELTLMRDAGFARVWSTQLPYEPDLLTVLAVALREVDTIEVATGVLPIQIQHPMQLAQRADGEPDRRRPAGPWFGSESPDGERNHVGRAVGETRAPAQRIP